MGGLSLRWPWTVWLTWCSSSYNLHLHGQLRYWPDHQSPPPFNSWENYFLLWSHSSSAPLMMILMILLTEELSFSTVIIFSAPQWWWSLARVYECTVFPLSAGTSAADGFYWPLLSFELQHWTAECPEECGGSQMQIFTQPICKKIGLIVGTSCLKTHFIHHHTQSQFLGSHLSKQTKSSLSLRLRSLLVPL